MQQKEKLERVLNVGNDKIFVIVIHMSVSFLNDSLFPILQKYNQFDIYNNVPST